MARATSYFREEKPGPGRAAFAPSPTNASSLSRGASHAHSPENPRARQTSGDPLWAPSPARSPRDGQRQAEPTGSPQLAAPVTGRQGPCGPHADLLPFLGRAHGGSARNDSSIPGLSTSRWGPSGPADALSRAVPRGAGCLKASAASEPHEPAAPWLRTEPECLQASPTVPWDPDPQREARRQLTADRIKGSHQAGLHGDAIEQQEAIFRHGIQSHTTPTARSQAPRPARSVLHASSRLSPNP